jgi:hypothetical protein
MEKSLRWHAIGWPGTAAKPVGREVLRINPAFKKLGARDKLKSNDTQSGQSLEDFVGYFRVPFEVRFPQQPFYP